MMKNRNSFDQRKELKVDETSDDDGQEGAEATERLDRIRILKDKYRFNQIESRYLEKNDGRTPLKDQYLAKLQRLLSKTPNEIRAYNLRFKNNSTE